MMSECCFSQGTKNSSKPKTTALTGSARLGTTYRISDKFDIYLDATTWLINSDVNQRSAKFLIMWSSPV